MTLAPTWMVERVVLPHAQATALWPLRARAFDAVSPRPVLGDHHAFTLARRLDLSLSGVSPGRAGAIAMRSRVIDDWVRAFLARRRVATVVEIGVGLDTRFERIDAGTQQWIDLDLPPIVELRRSFLAASPRRAHVPASAADERWLDRVERSPPPYCFVFEAVLAYLPPAEVPRIFARLAERFRGATLIVDAPRTWSDAAGVRAIERWGTGISMEEEARAHRAARFRVGDAAHSQTYSPACPAPFRHGPS